MKHQITGMAFLAAVVLVAACAAPPRADHATIAMGSTYTLQAKYSGSFSGPAEIQSTVVPVTWKGRQHVGYRNAMGTIVSAEQGDWIAVVAPDGKEILSWDPPIGFNWPLEVGKTWTRSFKFTNHAANQSFDIVANATVEAYEDLVLPAGTFKTFRVRVVNNVGLEETFWYSPDARLLVKQVSRRTAQSPQGAGTRETELKTLKVAR